MTVKVTIENGGPGEKTPAIIDSRGRQETSIHDGDLAPPGTANRLRYFSQLVSSNGDGTGTTNMNVDGSVTAQEFTIDSVKDYDIRIMVFAIVIADTAVVHNSFGNVAALSNGWTLKITESGKDTNLVAAATTGGEVIAQAALLGQFGDGSLSHELSNWTGNNDAQLIFFPLRFLVPGGLRIGRATQDRIVSVVNDDLTGLTEFTVRALGYKHFP